MRDQTPIRLVEAMQYRQSSGHLLLDGRLLGQPGHVALSNFETVLTALGALAAADGAACLSLYGLQFALDTSRDWSAEARNVALAGAAAQLRAARPHAQQAGATIEAALQRIQQNDSALWKQAGLVALQFDRAAERCGRRAAELLDPADVIVADPSCGAALGWMLQEVFRTPGARIKAPGTFAEADQQALQPALLVCGVETVTPSGSAIVGRRAGYAIDEALRRGIPRYVLLPEGPNPTNMPAPADATPGYAIVPAEHISALVTDRGIYRPEMAARYFGDGKAPRDVIPLS
jgi:methylthioribose-1-phosphate isomerase